MFGALPSADMMSDHYSVPPQSAVGIPGSGLTSSPFCRSANAHIRARYRESTPRNKMRCPQIPRITFPIDLAPMLGLGLTLQYSISQESASHDLRYDRWVESKPASRNQCSNIDDSVSRAGWHSWFIISQLQGSSCCTSCIDNWTKQLIATTNAVLILAPQ